MDPQFDDLWPRILASLVENGTPFDWRDIDGSEDTRFLECLRQLERGGLIKAVFRISSRLGEQGRIVFAQVTGITDQGIATLRNDANTDDGDVNANEGQASLDALQQLQAALAGQLVRPGAMGLSGAALQGVRQTLLNFAKGNNGDASTVLGERMAAIDDAVLQSLIIKWVAHAVHSDDASSVAALLARLVHAEAGGRSYGT